MALPVRLRPDFTAAKLRVLARHARDANQTRRLLALAAIYDGGSRGDAALVGGVGLQIIRDWVMRFNADGPDGLINHKAPGASSRLNNEQRQRLVALVESGSIPAISGKRGRPRRRPGKLHADKGYDYRRCRRACTHRGIRHRIARKGVESSSHLGKHRWVVERTFAWISRFRRLTVRYERKADIHLTFTLIACSLICLRALTTWF